MSILLEFILIFEPKWQPVHYYSWHLMQASYSKSEKIARLIIRLRTLVSSMDRNDLYIHSNLDEFYYMTKIEELEFLLNKYETEKRELESTLDLINQEYSEIFLRWSKDARWLNNYQHQRKNKDILSPYQHDGSS